MDAFELLAQSLVRADVRFVVIGLAKDRLFLVTHAEAIRDLSETDRLSEPKGPRASHKGKGQAGRRRPSRGRRPRS